MNPGMWIGDRRYQVSWQGPGWYMAVPSPHNHTTMVWPADWGYLGRHDQWPFKAETWQDAAQGGSSYRNIAAMIEWTHKIFLPYRAVCTGNVLLLPAPDRTLALPEHISLTVERLTHSLKAQTPPAQEVPRALAVKGNPHESV